jgi:hypothetical protein
MVFLYSIKSSDHLDEIPRRRSAGPCPDQFATSAKRLLNRLTQASLCGLACAVALVAALVALALNLRVAVVRVGSLHVLLAMRSVFKNRFHTLSPKLGLMPISSPPLTAVVPSMCTVRLQLPLQFPHDR